MPHINDDRELHTILAALRRWQRDGWRGASDAMQTIASDGGNCEPLTREEIDALCERINVSDTPPAVVITLSGGLVQTVEIDGQEVSAAVWDYDTEGAGPDEIETDAEGDEYVLRHS